ncbi:MAG TPA: hypothetical protein VHT05_03135 [Candidatus Elarobacter sp.]|jgi:Skp family chaperone for outer membrane proteins|nr:hypothetical protein [Candidatus Elarobacter sp.]
MIETRAVRPLLAALVLAALCGCSGVGSHSNIGLVDVQRISANWPKFQNYQNQLSADAATIERSKRSAREKAAARAALQAQFAKAQSELSNDVSTAAKQVAADRHLDFVFTRQFVGYGGVDITADVEKILKIDDKSTPAP